MLPANWRDLGGLRQLEKVCFPVDSWPLLDLIGVLSLPNIVRLKAVISDQMIGFVAGDKKSSDLGWIATIGVQSIIASAIPVTSACRYRRSISLAAPGKGVATDGDLAVVAMYHRGVATVDLTDPMNPVVLDSLTTEGIVLDVAVAGRYAYLAQAYASMTVVNLADPTDIQVVSIYQAANDVYNVEVVDGIVYLASYYAGVEVLDVSDPLEPYQLGLMPTPSRVEDVAVHGELVLAADRDGGLIVGAAQCPLLTAARPPSAPAPRLSARPNPFNAATTIQLVLDRDQEVELAVHDLRGRLMRRLYSGRLPTGTWSVEWNGRSDDGRPLASGVYLVRLLADEDVTIRRICLVK